MKKATTVDRRVLIDAIFEDVFDLDPVNREQHFEGLQVDASIIQSVKELLALSACESGPISRPAYALLGDEGEEFKPGDTLGVYTIIREIGRGGMGVIYLARRADGQFDRNVAIKILKPGKMVFANVSQFSHEINLLAGLEHPRLCRLYNSGITPGNFPYMVMEYVNGEPFDVIHTWEQPEILQFFQMICDGVGYAHTRGIVHGDLKPENILVRDKAPVIMDFGISAFSGAQPSLHMTPRYASPEQINQLSITTQSDIYSLGLIFSEYTKRFGHAELTAISNKATATDPIERYLTLDSFSSDIVNVLTSQPVSAVKRTRRYLIQKFVTRHKTAVLLALTFISLLVLSTAFYIYDNASAWAEAQQEADVANTLLEFQQSMLYGGVKTTEYLADFGAYGGLFKDTLVMEEFVFDVAQQAKTKLADNPEAMIRMLTVAGGALTSMQALPQADSVFDMATSIAGVSDHARARLFRYMSAHKVNVNDSPGAIDFANRSLAMFEQQYGQQHVETARSMMTLATPYRRAGKLAEADSLYKLAGPILKSYKVGGSDPEVFLYSISHVQTLNELKEYTKADSIIQSLYTEVDTSFQDYDVLYAYLLETHATNHYRQHNFEKAVALKEKAIYHMEKALGPKDLYVATYKNNLGVLYTELGRQDKAVEIYEEALQIYRSFSVDDAMYIASSLSNISMLHLFLGNFDQSWSYATEVLSFQESVLQIDSSLYGLLAVNASIAAAVNKQYETAIRLSEQSKGLLSSKYPEDHHLIRIHTRGKAMALLMSGDHEKARDVAVQALRDTSSYHARNLLLYRTVLKGAYEGLGNTLLADSVRTVMNQNADPLSQKSFRFVAEALEQSVKIP